MSACLWPVIADISECVQPTLASFVIVGPRRSWNVRPVIWALAQAFAHEVRKPSDVQGLPFKFVRISGPRFSDASNALRSGAATGTETRAFVLLWVSRMDVPS